MGELSEREVAEAGLVDWSLRPDGLHTRLVANDFATGLRLVQQIGAAAEAADHHPDLDLRYAYVDERLMSHDVGAVTDRDVRLARTISELAAAEGVPATPDA
jgi:4a-hydroxytetrahydrobiopterin dehydratase